MIASIPCSLYPRCTTSHLHHRDLSGPECGIPVGRRSSPMQSCRCGIVVHTDRQGLEPARKGSIGIPVLDVDRDDPYLVHASNTLNALQHQQLLWHGPHQEAPECDHQDFAREIRGLDVVAGQICPEIRWGNIAWRRACQPPHARQVCQEDKPKDSPGRSPATPHGIAPALGSWLKDPLVARFERWQELMLPTRIVDTVSEAFHLPPRMPTGPRS